jgi:hypothetical protein
MEVFAPFAVIIVLAGIFIYLKRRSDNKKATTGTGGTGPTKPPRTQPK